jgi:CDP-diacylglycerol--glycerol-3-phosphate 3-phosphatidyltransferase
MLKKSPLAQVMQKKAGKLFSSLHQNSITLLSLAFASAGLILSILQNAYLSSLSFLLSAACDALDGAVARAKGSVSAKGAYLDGISDRIVEFLFILSFSFYPLPPFILPVQFLLFAILFFGSSLTSFATAYAHHRKVASMQKIMRQPGILARPERVLLLALAMLLIPTSPLYSSAALFAAACLSAITAAQRILYFLS